MANVGAYRLLEPLGRGGSAVVWRAVGPNGSPVALKLLQVDKPDVRARFDREVRLLRTLGDDDGFVPILDFGDANGALYLVMPVLEGGSLREKLRAAGRFSPSEALDIGRALARAMERAHGLGILHRDLKPDNVLFTRDGRPLVADLGLAKHFRSDTPGASQSVALSKTGELRGTIGYFPPEQVESTRDLGPSADVFALGAILYELLAGFTAFSGRDVLRVLVAISDRTAVPIGEVVPEVPPWLSAVVMRALEPEPADRYEDAGALLRALERREDLDVAPRRHTARVVVLLSLAALALVGLGLVLARRPTPPPATAPSPRRPDPGPSAPGAVDRRELARLFALADQAGLAGQPARGVELLDKAERLAPDDPDVLANRGFFKAQHLHDRSGLDDLRQALDRAPNAGHYRLLGSAEFYLAVAASGPSQETLLRAAMADHARSHEIDPGDGESVFERGRIKIFYLVPADTSGVGDLERGVALAESAHTLTQTLAGRRAHLGFALAIAAGSAQRARDPTRAASLMTRAEAALDKSIEEAGAQSMSLAWYWRGQVRAGLGKTREAIADVEEFLRRDPDQPQATPARALLARLRQGAPASDR